MERSKDEVLRPERIRYRSTRLQRMLSLASGTIPVGVVILIVASAEEPADDATVGLIGMLVAVIVTSLIVGRYPGVTLTPTAAIVHSLRRRTIPWSRVQDIRVESSAGTRTVAIYEAGGRRTRLLAPTRGFLSRDRGFEEKFHTIRNWWVDHRGPDCAPVPPPWAQLAPWDDPPAPDANPYAPPA